mgnify:CR=1 FL=1
MTLIIHPEVKELKETQTFYKPEDQMYIDINKKVEALSAYLPKQLTEEEVKAVDLNTSMIHVDFMIGSADLSIVAQTYDGETVEIFKDGTWAI